MRRSEPWRIYRSRTLLISLRMPFRYAFASFAAKYFVSRQTLPLICGILHPQTRLPKTRTRRLHRLIDMLKLGESVKKAVAVSIAGYLIQSCLIPFPQFMCGQIRHFSFDKQVTEFGGSVHGRLRLIIKAHLRNRLN